MSRTVNELLEKRAVLTARQAEIRAEASRIDADLAALDRVIALLDPSYELTPSKKNARKATGWSLSRGELSDTTLAILRDAPKPLSAADCAELIVQAKGLPEDELTHVKANVAATLANLSKRNRVRRLNGDGRNVHWEIAR